MSNRPGIGYDAMHEVASQIMLNEIEGFVPTHLRHGTKAKPLGRYLRSKLADMLGYEGEEKKKLLYDEEEKVFELRQAARESSEFPTVRSQVLSRNEGKRASHIGRHKIYRQRKSL